ncbi:primase, polypeptide 1, 49kDa [Anaeromyces robustus]|uniref:DNA primase n=1 Tax=Anaeromyces robustus TaxID=1754192 RepID=A0A1Y1WE72_9FUNG|nr:primase, polypeptide 1, 49kDa [Anaeromyces robustus]|eukprot:ORX71685.1 primase, polypeptide 1, 49kDa [Anaeromyces robustus]
MEDNEFNSNLKYYYENLFPFKQYYQWLSYGNVNKEYFPHREFSFTFGNDIYSRFQSFENEKDFKTHLKDYNPRKIDIGAVYNTKPKNKKNLPNNALKPKEKELVFDIDMTDYDDIRTCCTGGDICKKCWTFMTIAIKIMDRALRDDFGFNHILWVYSGRRGVHCWVCDKRARQLSEPARKAIVGYLEVVKGGEQQAKKVNLPNLLHPSLRCAYTIVQEYFPKLILEDMDIFSDKKHYNKLLALVPDEEIRNRLYKSWEDSLNSPNGKWDELIRLVQQKEKKKKELKNFERDTIFQYTYPRLDFNVSLRLNHLLKSPFCIHPGTGRVCVPIDPQNCDNFNPFEVPTLNELVKEINELSQQSENLTPKDYQKNTSIEPYIKQFSNFIKSLNEEINNELRIKKELQERTSFDF